MPETEPAVRIDLAGFAREGQLGCFEDTLSLVQEADALGFGGIWFNEFHFNRRTQPHPSTLLLGSAILARTERLRFGTSILVLPLHHPLLLAEQLAQLDWQSGGRVDVGVGRGTDPASFCALGIDPSQARVRFAEALNIVREAWTQETFSYEGEFWSFQNVSVGPPPVQRPHPPIYMAAVSPDSIELAAGMGLPLLYSLEPNEDRQVAPFRAALARHDGNRAALNASSLSRYIFIAARRDEALAQLDVVTARLNAARAKRAKAADAAPPPLRTQEQMLADFAIAGTPEDCATQIRKVCARHDSRSLRLFFSANGLIPLPQAVATMRFFASQVLHDLSTQTNKELVT